jgi:hypothetical protein
MNKKLVLVIFLLGAVMAISAYAFAEEAASTAADTSTATPSATEAAPAKDNMPAGEGAIPAEEGVGEGVVTGEITALDASAGTLSIKGADGAEKAFNVVDGETILWKGIEDIKIADIKQGDKAEVGYYTNDAGKLVASWVDVVVPEQPAAAASTTQTAPVKETAPETSEE